MVISVPVNKSVKNFRLDFGSEPGDVSIRNMMFNGSISMLLDELSHFRFNQISKKIISDGILTINSCQKDPYMVWMLDESVSPKNVCSWGLLSVFAVAFMLLFHHLFMFVTLLKRRLIVPLRKVA